MVAGAGTDVGNLKITGTMNTQSVDSGFARVTSGFKQVSKFAKGVRADLTRMSQTAGRLKTALAGIGIVGPGIFIALAKGSPAVAGAMARIAIETERLKRAMGEALRPVFEWFAGAYSKFVDFVDAHPDLTRGLVLSVAAIAGFVALKGFLSFLAGSSIVGGIISLAKLVTTLGSAVIAPSVLTALGLAATLGGVAATAYVVGKGLAEQFKVGEGTTVPLSEAAQSQIASAGFGELADLQSRYGSRTTGTGYGPERTARTDIETGQLYGHGQTARDIQQEMYKYVEEELNRKDLALGGWSLVWS